MYIFRPFHIRKDFLCLGNVVVGTKSFDLPFKKILFAKKAEKVLERLKKFFFFLSRFKKAEKVLKRPEKFGCQPILVVLTLIKLLLVANFVSASVL